MEKPKPEKLSLLVNCLFSRERGVSLRVAAAMAKVCHPDIAKLPNSECKQLHVLHQTNEMSRRRVSQGTLESSPTRSR